MTLHGFSKVIHCNCGFAEVQEWAGVQALTMPIVAMTANQVEAGIVREFSSQFHLEKLALCIAESRRNAQPQVAPPPRSFQRRNKLCGTAVASDEAYTLQHIRSACAYCKITYQTKRC